MRITYENRIDELLSPAIVASSSMDGFPVINVQDPRLSKKWVSDSSTTQTVTIDFSTATAVQTMAVVSHNIASTATVTVAGNATDVWTAPSVLETLTWNSGVIFKFISTQTFQYWRFSFSGLTEAIQVGRLWLGPYVQIDPSSLENFSVELKQDDTIVYGKHRQKYATPGAQWRKIELDFPKYDTSSLTVIKTLYETVGNHSSFLFMNFDSLTTYPLVTPLYCSISGALKFDHTSNQRYTWSMTLEEDL